MNKKTVNTKYKTFNFVDCTKNEKCAEYEKAFHANDKMANRLLSVRDIESKVLDDFLKENNIKLRHLAILLFYRDSTIDEELLTAYKNVFKRVKLDFLNRNDFTFEYKNKYKDADFPKIFDDQKVKTRNMKMKVVIDNIVRKRLLERGFDSFQDYIKHLFNDFGLYPEGMWDEVAKKINTRIKDRSDFKENTGYEDELHSASFTVSRYEKENLIIPFIEYLKKRGLNISKLVRFELFKLGLIKEKELRLDEEDLAKIKKLKYEAPKIESNIDKIKEKLIKKDRETIVVLIPRNEKMKEFLKGSTGVFVREFVLKEFGMYPEIRGKDSSKVFINRKKAGDLHYELRKKEREEDEKKLRLSGFTRY